MAMGMLGGEGCGGQSAMGQTSRLMGVGMTSQGGGRLGETGREGERGAGGVLGGGGRRRGNSGGGGRGGGSGSLGQRRE